MQWDAGYLTLALDWTIRLVAAAVIVTRSRSTPTVRVAWLLVVLLIPFVGPVLYLAWGEVWTGRGALARHRLVIQRVRQFLTEASTSVADHQPRQRAQLDDLKGLALLERGDGVTRFGNLVELFGHTDQPIRALLRDVEDAESSVHLLAYIFLEDETGQQVAEALARSARRGVACRLLVDAYGSRDFLRSNLRRRTEAAGVAVEGALPTRRLGLTSTRLDHRNHRKIAVIDGSIGWTGSRNVADPAFAIKAAYAPWIDVMVRVRGPAVVDLQRLFVEDWLLQRDEEIGRVLTPEPPPIPHGVPVHVLGSGPLNDPRLMRRLTLLAFAGTRHELLITTPYFAPDEATITALTATAGAGVDARLIVPRRNDSRLVAAASRSFYHRLLEAGVEIFEYEPGLLHAKTITIDRRIGVVASANLDRRSFELNYEVNTIVIDDDFAAALRRLQLSYLRDSRPVHAEDWSRRTWTRQLGQNAAAMLSPLL